MERYEFQTFTEYGSAFGECPTVVAFDYEPDGDDEGSAIIVWAHFYSNGRHIYLHLEEAYNIRMGIEDELVAFAELQLQRQGEEARDAK